MRSNRPYVQIDPDVLEQARQINLLSYLRAYEPSNLVKVKGTTNVYCTAEHDSLKISNGKWYWWSRGFGGYSALDYLMKVREYGFVEAVEILTGQALADWKPPPPAPKKDEPKVLLLPPKNKDCDKVTKYLFGRGIDYSIIQECVADGTIYESADYHNAVFVGKDKDGTPKYAACRGTMGSFRLDASGSDKRYSFRLLAREPTATVHLFEAAIDLLSYATYLKCEGKDNSKIGAYYHRFIDYMKEHHNLQIDKQMKTDKWLMPHILPGCNIDYSVGRVLFAGEVAGFLNPMGEGISAGMESGYCAANAIMQNFGSPDLTIENYKDRTRTLHSYMKRQWSFVAGIADTFQEMRIEKK